MEGANQRFIGGNMRKGLYEDIIHLQTQNFMEGGLAFDRRLRELDWWSCVTIDWVHTLLQDGAFTVEVWLMCDAIGAPGANLKEFWEQSWEFPHSMAVKGRALWRVFDSFQLADDGSIDKIRASASELLGLSSMLRYYFDRHVCRDRPELVEKLVIV